MRIQPSEYLALDLRVHSLLADVPLHDVWRVDLEDGGPDRTVLDLRRCFSTDTATTASLPVRALFALRRALGDVFGWDEAKPEWERESYVHRLTDSDRERSIVPPGSADGFFKTIYVFPNEALNEARNATVHAFLCYALTPSPNGYRMYWAIYVKPVGVLTPLYMGLIDPFRRWIVYPAILDRVKRAWRKL